MIIIYKSAGHLPAEWDDFFPMDFGNGPRVMIEGNHQKEDLIFSDDGWIDAEIQGPVTWDKAKMVLSTILGETVIVLPPAIPINNF